MPPTLTVPNNNDAGKAVVVHRGARDAYQVAAALAEAGLLERLVTDLYWPNPQAPGALPTAAKSMLLARHSTRVSSSLVQQTLFSGAISQALDMLPKVPFSWRRRATRWTDAVMGRQAGELAARTNSLLLTYSYYAYHAFSACPKPGMLFQAHPHPASVRAILRQELADHPECAESLNKEWELALPATDFERLAQETRMAGHTLAASSFTRRTLIENGTAPNSISVIPYGIDLRRFSPASASQRSASSGKLRLLFVGIINQRKGIKYLLEALKLTGNKNIELTVCGRVVDDLSIFKPFASQVTVRPSVSFPELVNAYQQSDLFVFPSVAEGFAQVLLESLACGLPILSTTNTAAPDLIDDGIQGFVVEPRRPDLLAQRMQWAFDHPAQLNEMREAARLRAEHFTWERFRAGIVEAVTRFQSSQVRIEEPERVNQYV
jgi:glycosyltransferase involved in cell wall biosynthesis